MHCMVAPDLLRHGRECLKSGFADRVILTTNMPSPSMKTLARSTVIATFWCSYFVLGLDPSIDPKPTPAFDETSTGVFRAIDVPCQRPKELEMISRTLEERHSPIHLKWTVVKSMSATSRSRYFGAP